MPELRFPVPDDVLDRLDEIADVELEHGLQGELPDALSAAVARLDETMADHCRELGIQGDLVTGMEKLVYEMHRRKDERRYRAARVALEVMEAGFELVARTTAPLN